MHVSQNPLETQLEAALEAAENETARYHIRQALQLRVIERESPEDSLSA